MNKILLLAVGVMGTILFILLIPNAPLKGQILNFFFSQPTQSSQSTSERYPAKLTITPNPVHCCGEIFKVSGSGFYPKALATINIHTPNSVYILQYSADGDGNLTFETKTVDAGLNVLKVYQNSPRGGIHLTQMSEASFNVIQK